MRNSLALVFLILRNLSRAMGEGKELEGCSSAMPTAQFFYRHARPLATPHGADRAPAPHYLMCAFGLAASGAASRVSPYFGFRSESTQRRFWEARKHSWSAQRRCLSTCI